jgi:hypothetical protein
MTDFASLLSESLIGSSHDASADAANDGKAAAAAHQRQLGHLSSLLGESEANVTRLTDEIKVCHNRGRANSAAAQARDSPS